MSWVIQLDQNDFCWLPSLAEEEKTLHVLSCHCSGQLEMGRSLGGDFKKKTCWLNRNETDPGLRFVCVCDSGFQDFFLSTNTLSGFGFLIPDNSLIPCFARAMSQLLKGFCESEVNWLHTCSVFLCFQDTLLIVLLRIPRQKYTPRELEIPIFSIIDRF